MKSLLFTLMTCLSLLIANVWGQNQTVTLSPIQSEDGLPFTICIDEACFTLPSGIQSYASAIYQGKWVLLAGRTNGLHGFGNVGNNFPPSEQNVSVYVIDPATGASCERSLLDSCLSQEQVDNLSVTASQFFQKGRTLYIAGGYGINTETSQMETKATLTAIDLQQVIQWVVTGAGDLDTAVRQVSNPSLQVTGGFLYQANDHQPMLLMLGQNFAGLYEPSSNGEYTMQIRPFWLNDDGRKLNLYAKPSSTTYADYRRRDLNIVPIVLNNEFAYTALAGVFTTTGGVWTVPIIIFPDGTSYQPDPNDANTFKQGMNQYNCPAFGLYSTRTRDMFVVLSGGLSYGYFSDGVFTTDSQIPFINQVTTVKIDKNGRFAQYLMDGEYPFIASTGSNPGNQLLFGAEAQFFLNDGIPTFSNQVIQLDAISCPTVVGYIVGGIMSTLPNTSSITDSTASPYVFTVTITPKKPT